jgi:2-methylcitrate dehydratase PrpD
MPDLTLATDNNNKELMASPSPATPHVTKALANYIVSARYEDLPENVRKEGLRTLLNWVGVAVGGSHHETIDVAVDALRPFSGPSQASILGRHERFDVMNAASPAES